MGVISSFFENLYQVYVEFGEISGGGTWWILHNWPYENNPLVAWFSLILNGFFSVICIAFFRLIAVTGEFDKNPPKGPGDIKLSLHSPVVRLLRLYFGTYSKTSCELLIRSAVMSFGIAFSLQSAIWAMAGLSALLYFHLPNNIGTIPQAFGDVISLVIIEIMTAIMTTAQTFGNAVLTIFYFMVTPLTAGIVIYLSVMFILRRHVKKSGISAWMLLKRICFKLEYS